MKGFLCYSIFFLSMTMSYALTFTVDDITYTTLTDANTVKVVNFNKSLVNVVIPSEVTYKSVIYKVKAIGKEGLYGYKNSTYSKMESLIISEGIETIDANAVENNKQLKTVSLPNSLVEIGNYAFRNLKTLETVDFPNESSLQKIGSNAFDGCEILETLSFSSSDTEPSKLSPTFPESLESIGVYAFRTVPAFKNLILHGKLTNIGQGAFSECVNIEYIWLQEGISTIKSETFYGCTALTYVVLPSTITKVESSVFSCNYEKKGTSYVNTRTTNRTYVFLADTPFDYVRFERRYLEDFYNLYLLILPNIDAIEGDKFYVKESAIEQYRDKWSPWIASTFFDYKIPFNSTLSYSTEYREFDADFSVAATNGNKPFLAVEYGNDYVSFKSIDSNIVPAETGVLLRKSSDIDTWYQIAETQDNTIEENNLLRGVTYSDVIFPTNSDGSVNYVLYNGNFCRFNNAGSLGDHKSYLKLPYSTASQVKLSFDNNTTNITDNIVETQNGNEIYSLNGMRVADPYTGFYIINGKKVFISK